LDELFAFLVYEWESLEDWGDDEKEKEKKEGEILIVRMDLLCGWSSK